ncbi:vitellogenin [Trichonephila clavipes]|nr:vitellogenin [Trichonephila clavipes]
MGDLPKERITPDKVFNSTGIDLCGHSKAGRDVDACVMMTAIDVLNKAEVFQLKAEALGDKKRRYAILIDVKTNTRGSRLIEYQPTVDITLPQVRPIQLSGTIVFSKGSKEQISINMQSQSFDSPLTIKGNLAKEGQNINLDQDWKLQSFFNVTAFEQIHRMESSLGNQEGKGVFLDFGHHYEPDGRSYESVSLNAKLENIELRDRLQFSLETKLILAEHEDLSSNLRWDFSLKPFAHLKNDIIFRYGKNFEDNKHLVRVTQMTALNGDFETYEHMDIENKLGLTISCFDFDKYGALSFGWNFEKKPKVFVEIGVRTEKDREISLKYDYQHLTTKPLKVAAEGKIVYYSYNFLYKDQLHEIAPNEYQGKAVIIPREGKEITVDYVYKIKSQNNFHHEFDGTVNLPGTVVPVRLKADLALTSDTLKLNTIADTGNRPYSIDMNLQKTGASDVKLNTPFVEGTVNVNSENGDHSVRADIKTVGKGADRRIVVTGNIAENDIKTLTLEVQWDADNDAQKKLSIKATTSKEVEDGIDKHMITAAISYEGAINVDVKGKISTDLFRGPHYFRADFSGNMGPMAIEYTHQIKQGEVESIMKYLRSDSEKLRLDMKGKYVFTGNKFLAEYGLFLSSPYKTFDGKELYFQIMGDSSETTRVFIAEYRIKPAAVIGYVGKIDYQRKRGWPGQIRSNLLVTVHQRPLYEGSTHIDYGHGRYSWKTSFTPISKRKVNLFTSFEHAAKFAAFHHSMSTQLQFLQKIEVNALADLRNMEDAKVHSNLEVNNHKLYDLNSTLKMRSMIDFEGHIVLFSKITPSLHVLYKTQSSGQVTKYIMNLEVDSVNIITGSGELKKRKKGFNSDMIFNYREKEFLVLNINQEAKSKQERSYVVKLKTPWRAYTANIKVNKEKKGSVKYETVFCRSEGEKCISIDAYHKEPGETDEWQISYKRGDVDFSIERITASTNDLSRFHTVIYKGDKRYGYDLRLAKEGKGHSISLGIILPSREIVTKTYGEISLQKPRLKFEFSADARKYPERKLITDIRFENHLTDNNPSKLNVIISHPIYEKPIELQLIADLEPTSNKILTAEMSADYSNDPEDKLIGKLTLLVESKDGNNAETMLLNIYHKDEEHLDFVLKINGSETDNEEFVGVFWNWNDEGDVDMEAFLYYRYLKKERKFYFEYNRPKLVYQLDGSVVTPQTLLGDTCELDLKSVYNGEITKAKLIADYASNCYRLLVFNVEGQKTRVMELCSSRSSRKILSILSESLDEEGQWTFDFSFDIIRKSWRTIKIMSNFNLEFLGATLFKATSLGDELSAAGVGTLPFSNSPRMKLIRNAFHTKIFQPSVRFFIPEAARFIADVKRDTAFAAIKLNDYYNSLPPLTEVKETIEKISEWVESFLLEVWKAVESYYKEYFKNVINFIDKATGIVKAICNNNEDCRAFVKAYNDDGWKGLANQIENFIKSLPPKRSIPQTRKSRTGGDKRRKQKDPKKKAVEPPPEETDNDKCRHHKEIQKRIKMMNGRLSFLEHCIQSEKEFPDLTDDDALVGFQNEHDELSSQKEQNLGELALFLPCPVLDCPENANNSTKQNDPPEPPDEHRIVTDYLKEISEEFYVIDPPDSRPLKVVIKGLPISTEIDEIQEDLTSQGFSVEKVAQLTRSKTKSPLPIFMVELEKKPDSPDIFKMKKCCCLTVQIDAFNRRPGVSQCYNCNLFNHSSKNCFMRTRCLKCGKSHRTNECPIKEKIENPVCINCNKTGHMANWSQCEEFPKRKLRKGETIRNRNTSTETNKTSKGHPNLSFAAALSGASNKNNTPGTSAATEEIPSINEKVMKKTLALKTR